jgi:hypothetical protein
VSLAFNGKEYVIIGNLIKLEPQNAVSDINKFNVDSAAYDLKSFVLPVANSSNGLDYEVTNDISSSIQHLYYILDGHKLFWNGQKYVTVFVDHFLNEDFALISNDGKTFTKHNININDPSKLAFKINLREEFVRHFSNIIFDGKSFFALYNTGIGTAVVKSNDGIEWDIVWFDKIDDLTFGEVIYGGGSYFIITRDNLYSSNNGDKWVKMQSKLFSEIMNNDFEKSHYDIRCLYIDGTFYLQLVDVNSSHFGKGQNKIYITKDMDNYTCLEINHDIGRILYVKDNIVITSREVLTIKK